MKGVGLLSILNEIYFEVTQEYWEYNSKLKPTNASLIFAALVKLVMF